MCTIIDVYVLQDNPLTHVRILSFLPLVHLPLRDIHVVGDIVHCSCIKMVIDAPVATPQVILSDIDVDGEGKGRVHFKVG